ncbi:SDR family NAD(P)-dependent oxidoreductase, partial [Rhizobiaceae sp. 2RAB30]
MNQHAISTGLQAAIARGRNFDVTGRVVVITGAGQGIGREYALQFAAAGALPVIAELNEAKARAVQAEIEAQGGKALTVVTDISDARSVDAMVAEVLEQFGRIDVLVNNAGIGML